MKIDFEAGEAGFFEARALHLAAHAARSVVHDDGARECLDFLDRAALQHLRQAEFEGLRARHGRGDGPWPNFSVLKHLWRQTLGTSQLETQLSEQRSQALARAERAEHSAFEALADTARLERERDRARADLVLLKNEIELLKAIVEDRGHPSN